MKSAHTVIGVDVGSSKKGFHAVALCGTEILGRDCFQKPTELVEWCGAQNAQAVAVDAPCRWSVTGRARRAEREMMELGIHAFATPTREKAEQSANYAWMVEGANLYRLLERRYSLFDGNLPTGRVCIETYPHAAACALAGAVISAKRKSSVRRKLIREARLDDKALSNIDYIDAALCALSAQSLLQGKYLAYGDASEGFIVVPSPTLLGTLL